jgi:ATP-dependent DNA helicase RecG
MPARPALRSDDALARPLSQVTSGAYARPMAGLGVHTVGDLLRHYPRRYAEPGSLSDLSALVEGEHVTVVAQVVQATSRTISGGRFMMEVQLTDGVGRLRLAFFVKRKGVLAFHEQRLVPGRRAMATGVVSTYKGQRQLLHPDYQMLGPGGQDEETALEEASWPMPIYPASKAIPSWQIRKGLRPVLEGLSPEQVPDPLPAAIRAHHHYPPLYESLVLVHVPHEDADWRRGMARLRYEEAFVLQAELARRRSVAAARPAVRRARVAGGLLDAFDARLPFALTAGQREVGEQIAAELDRPHPMQRLLQGEVGSGKTVVALRAMLQVVDAGGQAALLAPTEVLAAQHATTLRTLLGDLAEGGYLGGAEVATRVTLLTGSQSAAERRQTLAEAAGGQAGIVVGTHALLSAHVQFAELGLVVVDEQHRFGVEQRDELRTRADVTPHLLVMTATPIPRTVAMTVFGDLETSVLREVPAGRSGVRTFMADAGRPSYMARTWALVREHVDGGGRAFVVCPRISSADDARDDEDGADLLADDEGAGDGPRVRRPLRAVLDVADDLAARPELAGVPIGVLHGRLSPEAKEAALAGFASGAVPVLVCTTVIEVGVDVPAATAMVVLDADRFGLSQLHQLRGRVGRGSAPAVCLLVSHAVEGTPAWTRLKALVDSTDGFALAAADLELRREGDVLGAAQSGAASSLRLLRVARDADLIERARADAVALVETDPDLSGHPALAAAIEERLAGDREEFLDRT